MADELSAELAAYEQVPLDESVPEGRHRGINWVSSRATGSRLPFWSSSQRLQQNMADFDGLLDHTGERQLFVDCMRQWKAILQTDAARERRLVGSKMKGRCVVGKVYRLGASNQVDWSTCKELALVGPRPKNMGALSSDVLEIKRDFMNCVLDLHGTFSFASSGPDPKDTLQRGPEPIASAAPASSTGAASSSSASPRDLAAAQVPTGSSSSPRLTVFQVLNLRPGNRVLAYSLDMKSMRFPIQVQFFNVLHFVGGHDPTAATELHIVPEGNPVLADALNLGNWVNASMRLVRWETTTSSSHPGCLCLRGRRLAIERLGWDALQDQNFPAMLMMRKLGRNGWTMTADDFYDHSPADARKKFSTKGVVSRKSYLRCLMSMPQLWEQGLQRLRGGRHEMYYRAVLILENKNAIPDNLLVRDYKRLIDESGVSSPLMDAPPSSGPRVIDASAAMSIEAEAAQGDEQGHVDRLLALLTEGDEGAARALGVEPLGDGELQVAPQPPAASVVAPASGAAAGDSSDPSDDDSSCDGDGDASADVATGPAVRFTPFKRIRLDLPSHIDGIALEENIHNEDGRMATGQRYHRIALRCPLADCAHVGGSLFRKNRNIGETTTRHFGRLEPVGYLGAWCRAAPLCSSREQHMKYRPSMEEVEAYLTSAGLL